MASVFFFLQVTTCDFQRAIWHPHPVGCDRFISIRIGEIVNSLKSPVTPRLDRCGTRQIWIWKKKNSKISIWWFLFELYRDMMWRQNYVRTISLVVFFCCWVRLTLVLIIWTSFFISFFGMPMSIMAFFHSLSLSLLVAAAAAGPPPTWWIAWAVQGENTNQRSMIPPWAGGYRK